MILYKLQYEVLMVCNYYIFKFKWQYNYFNAINLAAHTTKLQHHGHIWNLGRSRNPIWFKCKVCLNKVYHKKCIHS